MRIARVGAIDNVSRLVMGTMAMSIDAPDIAFELFDAFLEAGGTCFDTAAIYGGGASERVVGNWIADRDVRSRIVLLGKGAATTACTPELITRELHESLDRLGTDRLDLYLMHRDNPDVPVGEFVDVLNQHRESGLIGEFGGSNWTTARLTAAEEYATSAAVHAFAASSPQFSLAEWNFAPWDGCYAATSDEDRTWYERSDLALFAWSSQASGYFTNRFETSEPTSDLMKVWDNEANRVRRGRAVELAQQKSMTLSTIALAYVTSQAFESYALIGPRSVEELHDSLRAADLLLSPAEISFLRD